MIPDLSVIIAARNEEFLQNTIDDVLKNKRGNTEVIVVLDGYWPDKGIPQHPDVRVMHHSEAIGQRASVNRGVKLSRAKYIMKLDAHCALGESFDTILMADCEYDWTVIPRMYNLHAFDWKCKRCGKRTYQGPKPIKCKDCGSRYSRKKIVWKAKTNPCSEFYYFDNEFRFKYWREFKKRPEGKPDIADTMSSLGACFFMHRERYWDIEGLDEGHGGWGQVGTELACKSWLSGGRQVTNKRTWFAHMFRTGGGFGFPYPISGKDVKKARRYSADMWSNNKWHKAKHDLDWLLNKFAPIPTWNIKKELSKGIVYYTNNLCEDRIADTVRRQISRCANGFNIISVSQYPLDFGKNFVYPEPSGVLTMFKQILKGLEESRADIIFLCEHDIIYHPSHFDFTPPKDDVFYYNTNTWKLRPKDGQALHYLTKQTSGLCAYRELLIAHYRKRVKMVEESGFTRKMGFEPGGHNRKERVDDYKSESWKSVYPNVDIRHDKTLTANRFSKDKFRRKPKEWKLADEIPFWGKTKNRFDDFLRDALQKTTAG